jgi:hypothetical protein
MNETPGPSVKTTSNFNEDEDVDFKMEDIPEYKGIKMNNEKEMDTKRMKGMYPLIMKMNKR